VDFAPKFFDAVENWERIGSKLGRAFFKAAVAAEHPIEASDA
jgi:hypothetical protein